MACIEERPGKTSVRYRALVRVRGYPPQSATFDRKTDAKIWAKKVETELRTGRYLSPAEASRHTVAEMIDRYLREVMPKKADNSRSCQVPQLRWWMDQVGDVPLSAVTPARIARLRDELAAAATRQGRLRSPSTVVRYMAALSHCFTMATREWGWLDNNPMRNVSRPKEPRGRTRFLSDSERERLLAACRGSKDPYLYAVVVLALSTGMRRGEILGLTWDRVDFERRAMVLLPEHTKTSEVRVVPLVGHAFDVLRRHFEKRQDGASLVFPAPADRNGPDHPISIRTAWYQAAKRASIEDFHFHDLRHTAASYLLMSGATLGELAEVLGHKTLEMVKRYAHLTESHTSKVVERMNLAFLSDT